VCNSCVWYRDCLPTSIPHCERYTSTVCIIAHYTVLVIPDLPAPQNLEIMMDIEQNRVSLSWDNQILSDMIDLAYRLYYSIAGGCGVTTCKKSECRIERRRFNPRNSNSASFGMTLSPYANYTWRLELTYSRGRSNTVLTETVVNVQTSQSG